MFITTTGTVTANAFADRDHTSGAYTSNAYTAVIRNLYNYDDTTLREKQDKRGTRYEILLDGIVSTYCDTLKEAQSLFSDFTGLTKTRMEKVAKVAAAA